jgi:hypothetical protein
MLPLILLFGCASDVGFGTTEPDRLDDLPLLAGPLVQPTDAGTEDPVDTGSDPVDTAASTDTGEAPVGCTVSIPASLEIIKDDGASSQDGLVAWVCRNRVLSFTGTGGTFYLGDRAEIVLSSGGNTIYVPANARIHNFADGNRIILERDRSLSDESPNGASIETCDQLDYDLGGDRDPGCR